MFSKKNSQSRLTIFLLITILISGCRSSAHLKGPLQDIETYQVMLFVSPYGDTSVKETAKQLKKKLKESGRVAKQQWKKESKNPVLLVSVQPEDSATPSCIKVIDQVKVEKNGYPLTRCIWSYPDDQVSESIIEEREGMVYFSKRQRVPKQPKETLDVLVAAFMQEFEKSHPQNMQPVFLISK